MNHSTSTANHNPFAAVYADATARLAATGFERQAGGGIVAFNADDVGKLARQTDTNSIWMLTDDSPVTWLQVDRSGLTSTNLSDFNEAVEDRVGALLADGDVDFTYDDPGNTETNIVRKASENFALPGDISPSQITSNQNDYNPTSLSTASTLRINSDAARDITGLQGGADGRLVILHNIGSFTITLKDENASSTAANRFALSADSALATDQACLLQYDSTSSRWRLIAGPSSAGAPGGSNTQLQFNNSGAFGGNAGLTYNVGTGVLSLAGNFQPIGTSGTQNQGDSSHEWGTINTVNLTLNNIGGFNFRSALKIDDGVATFTNGGVLRIRNNANAGATWASPATSPAQITSNQNNYDPGGIGNLQRWNTDASRNITGIDFFPGAGPVAGQRHLIVNVGSFDIVLKHQDTGSVASLRLLCSTGADITLTPNQAADIIYDSTTAKWRVFKRN